MNDNQIPDHLRNFIILNFDSISQIEVLRLMLKDKEKFWTEQQVKMELQSSDQLVGFHLKKLHEIGILTVDNGPPTTYRYLPTNSEIEELSMELIFAFKIFPSRIIEIIYTKPNKAVLDFAQAFKFRKDSNDG